MAYKLEPLERSFGAVITEINLVNIQDSDFDSLYSDWLKYALLIFPQQHLTNEEQINFAKRFGEMEYDISELSNELAELIETIQESEDRWLDLSDIEN